MEMKQLIGINTVSRVLLLVTIAAVTRKSTANILNKRLKNAVGPSTSSLSPPCPSNSNFKQLPLSIEKMYICMQRHPLGRTHLQDPIVALQLRAHQAIELLFCFAIADRAEATIII